MKISTRGRYGLRLMLYLSLHYEKGYLSLKEISKSENISEKYLEQIINPLTKSHLVKSMRGAQGGYILAKDPSSITVGQVLRILEGSMVLVDCLKNPQIPCPRRDDCTTITLWEKIKEAVDNVIDHTTLEDLTQDYKARNSHQNYCI